MSKTRALRQLRSHPRSPLFVACLFFSLMALSVKLLTGPGAQAAALVGDHDLPSVEVAFFRSLLCLVLVLPWVRSAWRSAAPGCGQGLLLRGLTGGLAMICYFQAIDRLSLSCAVLLNYTSPLWAGAFALVLLRERLSPAIWVALPMAFSGIVVVMGAPGLADDPTAIALGLGSAVLAGAAYTALRGLRKAPPVLVVAALSGVTCVLTAPLCWSVYVAPAPGEWALLWTCAASSALAQWCLTLGYRWTSTASASTVGLATVATTTLLSVALLGEPLSGQQAIGVAMILLATSQAGSGTRLESLIMWALRRPAGASA